MSDTATASKTAKAKGAVPGWTAAADGASVSKTYKLGSAADAVKLAKRALQLAEKGGRSMRIDYSGTSVTFGLVAAGGVVADAERRLAKRLDGGKGEAKAPKTAKPAKDPKAARTEKPSKADKAAKRAAKAAKAAKATPGSQA